MADIERHFKSLIHNANGENIFEPEAYVDAYVVYQLAHPEETPENIFGIAFSYLTLEQLFRAHHVITTKYNANTTIKPFRNVTLVSGLFELHITPHTWSNQIKDSLLEFMEVDHSTSLIFSRLYLKGIERGKIFNLPERINRAFSFIKLSKSSQGDHAVAKEYIRIYLDEKDLHEGLSEEETSGRFVQIFSALTTRQLLEAYKIIFTEHNASSLASFISLSNVFLLFGERSLNPEDRASMLELSKNKHPAAKGFKYALYHVEMSEKEENERQLAEQSKKDKARIKEIKAKFRNELTKIDNALELGRFISCNQSDLSMLFSMFAFKEKIKVVVHGGLDIRKICCQLPESRAYERQVLELFDFSFLRKLCNEDDKNTTFWRLHKEWIEAGVQEGIEPATPTQSPTESDDDCSVLSKINLSDVVSHYPYGQAKNRYHLFTVEYQGEKNDRAKAKILKTYQQQISRCGDEIMLATLRQKTFEATSEEYCALKTGTGLFTRIFGRKTDSVRVLESMFDEAAKQLKP